MTLSASPIYAGILALIFIFLSARVIARRGSAKVTIGDGGDKDLIKRIRVHANFVEYAPFGALLLVVAELQGAPIWVIHILGILLIAGRCSHAIGLGSTPQIIPLRFMGMVSTFFVIGVSAIAAIAHSLF